MNKKSKTAQDLVSIRASYKSNKHNGVSITLNQNPSKKQEMIEFYENAKSLRDNIIQMIKDKEITVQEIYDDITVSTIRLKEDNECNVFELKVKQQVQSEFAEIKLQTMFVLIADIWALTKLGKIKENKYNGVLFVIAH